MPPTSDEHNNGQQRARLSRLAPWGVAICGLLVTLGTWNAFDKEDEVALAEHFRARAQEMAEVVEDAVRENINDVWSVRGLYEASDVVTEDELAIFFRLLRRNHTGVETIGWAPRVLPGEISTFEIHARQDGFENYQVHPRKTVDAQSDRRMEHFPIRLMVSNRDNAKSLGRDLGTDPSLAGALQRVLSTRRLASATAPALDDDGAQVTKTFVFLPVLRTVEHPTSTKATVTKVDGVVFAQFDAASLVEKPLKIHATDGIDLTIYDTTDGRPKQQVYAAVAATPTNVVHWPSWASIGTHHLHETFDLALNGLTWQLHCSAAPAFVSANESSTPLFALLCGLTVTGVLTALVSALTGRAEAVSRLAAQRTKDLVTARGQLEHAVSQLEAVQNSALDGIITIDEQGTVIATNPATERILGFHADEIIGNNVNILIPSPHREQHDDYLARFKAGQHDGVLSLRREVVGQHKDGSVVPLELSVSELRLDGARVFTAFIHDISERKQFELQLAKLSLVAKKTRHSVIIADSEGRIEWVNDSFTQLKGYSPDEVIGRKHLDLISGTDTDPDTIRLINDRLRRRERVSTEILGYDKSGNPHWVALEIEPICDGTGELVRYIATQVDITDRKLAQMALRESEARYRGLYESSRNAIVVIRGDHIVECNPTMVRMFQCQEKSELCGRSLLDLSPHTQPTGYDSAELMPEFIREAIRDGSTYFEWVFCRNDGMKIPCEVLFSLIDTEGEYVIQASVRNVSFQKKEQAKLRESEERFRQLAESIDDVFWITDANTHEFVYVSPAFETVWGVPCAEVYRSSSAWGEAIHPDDRERVRDSYYRSAAAGDYDVEFRLIHADGTVHWIHDSAFPVRNAEGHVYRIAGIARDVTSRKQYETELKRAKAKAEEASVAKSQFLASMSHELRTPLNGVIGMTELLAGTDLSEKQKQFVDACHNSGESLLQLINDILDFSKIEAGKLELDAHEFDLEKLVTDTIDTMVWRATDKGLELPCFVDQMSRLVVRGDGNRLRQVLVNLLSNAIKFTESGEVAVRTEITGSSDDQIRVRFSVTDTGIGIPQDKRDRLFKSFSQVDASTTRNYGGTGLGLAISQSLVDLMGGTIGVDSEAGVGSTFWFEVPLALASETSEDADHAPTFEGGRALIVDDNETNRQILTAYLVDWGVTSVTTASVDEALAAVDQADAEGAPFDFVLTDYNMPRRSGVDLADALSHRKEMPIILLGSTDVQMTSDELVQHNIRATLRKPIRRQALRDELCKLLATPNERADGGGDVPSAEVPSAQLSGRVLLAEDNSINRMFMVELMSRLGCQCDTVVNGREAVEAVQQQTYDVVLMDCQMPEMDGFEASRRIRELESAETLEGHLPIIALTANAVKGDRERCLEAGMDEYLSKPVQQSEVTSALTLYLGDGTATADAETSDASEETKPDGAAPPINARSLLERCFENVEFAGSLLDEFEMSGMSRVDEIRQSMLQKDASAAAEAAHALKGAAGILCAESVQQLAAEIEFAGRSSAIDELDAKVNELASEMQRCLDYVPKLRLDLQPVNEGV